MAQNNQGRPPAARVPQLGQAPNRDVRQRAPPVLGRGLHQRVNPNAWIRQGEFEPSPANALGGNRGGPPPPGNAAPMEEAPGRNDLMQIGAGVRGGPPGAGQAGRGNPNRQQQRRNPDGWIRQGEFVPPPANPLGGNRGGPPLPGNASPMEEAPERGARAPVGRNVGQQPPPPGAM